MSSIPPRSAEDLRSETGTPSIEASLVFSALLLLLEGASLAAGIEFGFYDDRPGLFATNAIPRPARTLLLAMMGVCGVLPVLTATGYVVWKRSRRAVEQVECAARIGAPLMLTALVPWLFDWRVFKSQDLLFIAVATVFGLLLERSLRMSFIAASGTRWLGSFALVRTGRAHWIPGVLVGVMTAGLALHFAYYTILNHYLLLTHSWDLAIFDNMFWNLIRGKWFKASPDLGRTGSHIQYHANFVAYLLTPFYALRQKADTLLVIQAVIVAGGAVPVYLIAKRRLDSAWYGAVLAYAYCVHGPLHGPVFYDFHFLTLAPFFIGWVLYFYERERLAPLIVTFAIAILLREDQSATLAMAALFFLLSGKRPRWALIGGAVSAVMFVVIKFGIMPLHRSTEDKQTFVWIFRGLLPEGEYSFGAVLKTVVTNPMYTAKWLMDTDKIIYALQALGPVLLLPFRNRRTWMLFVPASIFTLLATQYKPVYQSEFQYTANWSGYLFFATAVCLSEWRNQKYGKQRIGAAVCALAVTATAFSYQFGSLFQHNTFKGGFHQVQYEWNDAAKKRLADLYSLAELIPPNASVAATELEAPHVSNREDCFTMRFGHDNADYLLVRIAEASAGPSHTHMTNALKSGKYSFVKRAGEFALWMRGGDHKNDDIGARLIRVRL